MRVIRYVQAGVLSLAATTFCADLPIYGNIGLSSPAVAKEFWTKKRVNGRWVKGHFPKHAGREKPSSSRHARQERERDGRETRAEEKQPDAPVTKPDAVITGSTGSVSPANVVSVTFDVKTQTKIVTFSDGKVVKRPFQLDGDFAEPTTPKTTAQQLISDQDAAEKLRAALLLRAESLRTGTASR